MNLFKIGFASLGLTNAFLQDSPDDDIDKDWTEIVSQHGFVYEKHSVTTDDGYILGLYRISGKAGVS